MKQFIYKLLFLIAVISVMGCENSPEPSKQVPTNETNVSELKASDQNDSSLIHTPTTPPEEVFEIVGTVAYKEVEGGFYAIDADDGSKYDPMNLPESFRKDGLKVKVTAYFRQDAISLHMYGSNIDIVDIAAR